MDYRFPPKKSSNPQTTNLARQADLLTKLEFIGQKFVPLASCVAVWLMSFRQKVVTLQSGLRTHSLTRNTNYHKNTQQITTKTRNKIQQKHAIKRHKNTQRHCAYQKILVPLHRILIDDLWSI